MLRLLSNNIVKVLLVRKLILQAERELYCFGATVFIIYIISFFTTILIGFLFNVFAESIIFYFSYLFLRIYVGGYHASNFKSCFIMTFIITAIVLYIISCFNNVSNMLIIICIMGVKGFTLSFIGPVENKNKELNEEEIIEYNKKIKIVLNIEFLIFLLMVLLKQYKYAYTVNLTWTLMLIMSITGLIKNKFITRRGLY